MILSNNQKLIKFKIKKFKINIKNYQKNLYKLKIDKFLSLNNLIKYHQIFHRKLKLALNYKIMIF